jgi:prophage tail gpP-like protein
MTTERRGPIEPANRVSLEVGGLAYGGWKSIKIRQSIEQLAGAFSLEVSERWPEQSDSWAIEPGAACTVKIGTDVMITGYVDVTTVKASPTEHTINIQGRDKTGDLVDCSAPPREWVGLAFEQIAVDLCAPFGVEVTTQLETGEGGYKAKKPGKDKAPAAKAGSGGGKLPRKASNSGETVHRLLEKLAKMQGVLLVSDRVGGLQVTRAGLNGRCTDVLALGQNLKSIDYERSFANLFSEITVKGQAHGASSPAAPVGLSAARVKAVATVKRAASTPGTTVSNAAVQRHRPLILMAEDQADAKRCADRAQWEAGTREAKSKKLVVAVQGWRQSSGELWTINTLVRMKCPYVREDEDLLISTIEYSLDQAGGTVCSMTLYSPQAFDVLKEIPKPDAPTGGAGASGLSGVSAARAARPTNNATRGGR